MNRFFYFLVFVAQAAHAQWQFLGEPGTFTARTLFVHKDKAFASINGTLCVEGIDAGGMINYYPVDRTSRAHTVACDWADLVITGGQAGVAFVYSDINTGQQSIAKNLGAGEIKSIATLGSTMLFGTPLGLILSEDTLKTYTKITEGIKPVSVNDLKVFGTTIYAATDSGVYHSETLGKTWTRFAATRRPANTIHKYDDTLYIGNSTGLYHSADDGITWHRDTSFKEQVFNIKETESALWLFDQNRLFKKLKGQSWVEVKLGLPGRYTSVVEAGRTTFVSSYWGISYKEQYANIWTAVPAKGFTFDGTIVSLACEGSQILAGTDIRGVFSSKDKGRTWTLKSPPFHREAVYAIQSTHIQDKLWYASSLLGVYKSGDEGQSWRNISPAQVWSNPTVNSFFQSGDTLWICTYSGLYYSTDHGSTWSMPTQGPRTAYNLVKVASGKMYASGDTVLYESSAPYQTWMPSGLKPSYFTFKMDQYGDTLYMSSGGDAVYRSFDAGSTWHRLAAGLSNLYITDIKVSAHYALAITGLNEVFILTHTANEWLPFLTNTGPSHIGAMTIYEDTVYASEPFGGLWKRALSDYEKLVGVEKEALDQSLQMSPNPVHDILYLTNWQALTSIALRDAQGRKIRDFAVSPTLDLSTIPTGLYSIVFVHDRGNTSAKKFIKH